MFTFIDSLEDLDFLNNELMNKPYVGVDTEFRRTNKHNMKLGMLQVNDEEETYLIDTVLIKNPENSASFLFSESVTKIFHSCKEDLEAIYSWTRKEMVNIFDTQLANSFLENDYSISYQSLVQNKLGITLEKSETRSNWIRRPLSDSQLKYAALDVEYLIPLYLGQKLELSKSNKIDWFNEDIERLIRLTFNPSKNFSETNRILSRTQETELLMRFNEVIERISTNKNINATLLFSKKTQKDFLRLVIDRGIDYACDQTTVWRKNLLKEELLDLLK